MHVAVPKTHNLHVSTIMSSHPPSTLYTLLHFERTLFPEKFDYDLTPGVIEWKFSGDRLSFCTLPLQVKINFYIWYIQAVNSQIQVKYVTRFGKSTTLSYMK